jgi:uncharacterized protein YjiS (DUF1127 family)
LPLRSETLNNACAGESLRGRRALNHSGSTPAVIEAILACVRLWRTRSRTRRQLAVMYERELQDIGTCWSEISDEIAKPFWRI